MIRLTLVLALGLLDVSPTAVDAVDAGVVAVQDAPVAVASPDVLDTLFSFISAEKLDHIFIILGLIVPVLSFVAGLINSSIRKKQAAGEVVSPGMLWFSSALNIVAINLDKAVQHRKLAKAAVVTQIAGSAKPAEPPKEG